MSLKTSSIVRPGLGLPAALALMLALVAPADAALIDFESLADLEIVTNQFAGDGIVFGNAIALTAGITLNEIDFPPSSGVRVITGIGVGPMTVGLSSGAFHVSLQITTFDVALVQYYDSLDTLLGQTPVAPNLGSNTLVEFDSPGPAIAGVRIGSQANGNAFNTSVDDFAASFSVPEPSAVLLMVCGLLSIGSTIFRRRRL